MLTIFLAPVAFAIPYSVLGYDMVNETTGVNELTLSPGEDGVFHVYVENLDSVVHSFQAYVVDRVERNNDLYFANIVDEQFAVGLWGVESDTLSLESGESGIVELSFDLPDDVELGDYPGGIYVAAVDEGDGASGGVGTVILTQVGFAMTLHVVEASEFEEVKGDLEAAEDAYDEMTGGSYGLLYAGLVILLVAVLIAYQKQGGKKKKK